MLPGAEAPVVSRIGWSDRKPEYLSHSRAAHGQRAFASTRHIAPAGSPPEKPLTPQSTIEDRTFVSVARENLPLHPRGCYRDNSGFATGLGKAMRSSSGVEACLHAHPSGHGERSRSVTREMAEAALATRAAPPSPAVAHRNASTFALRDADVPVLIPGRNQTTSGATFCRHEWQGASSYEANRHLAKKWAIGELEGGLGAKDAERSFVTSNARAYKEPKGRHTWYVSGPMISHSWASISLADGLGNRASKDTSRFVSSSHNDFGPTPALGERRMPFNSCHPTIGIPVPSLACAHACRKAAAASSVAVEYPRPRTSHR